MANNRNNQQGNPPVSADAEINQVSAIEVLNERIAEQAQTIDELNASIELKDSELAQKDAVIEAMAEEIADLKANIHVESTDEPAEEIDPERARIIASAQADIEELRAAKRRG